VRVKRHSKRLELTRDYVVVDCRQQGVLRCRKCGLQTLIVISSHSHQLRWCSHCVSQLTLTSFETDKPTQSRQDINKWVDNGSVQLIETPDTTFVITFREQARITPTVALKSDSKGKHMEPYHEVEPF
jgi:hypothetical protein